ncbi:uncharacterized protein LOC110821677 [Carica papaya]|uniref:uncharacterized protein LOC110821677 n=1 Tax=Carica papaya TaxID=3649 RepID=UPI000B8CFE5F|nr:uncharacterized protein LOC110821677 [Carica papaya]
MFGGLLSTPTNSPHLRKSGSKPVVSDLGDEFGDAVEDGLLHSAEANDLKSTSMPMVTIAKMPSPILLWRFKVLLFLIWSFTCCKFGWDSVMRMSVDLRDLFLYEAFLYYNPLLLVTMMVWLWGVNLWVFSQSTVNYAKIFDLDQNHLTHREIWKVKYIYVNALKFFVIYKSRVDPFRSVSLRCLPEDKREWRQISLRCMHPTEAEPCLVQVSFDDFTSFKIIKTLCFILQVLLYCAAMMILIFPFDIFYFSSRYYLLRTLWRIVLPLQAISFSDFFLADILTSMAKVFSDLERSVCRMVHRQIQVKSVITQKISKHFYVFVAAKVYCLIKLQFLNVASNFTRIFKFSKPSLFSHLFYGRKWVYFLVIGSNLILRCTWTYKLSAHLRHNYLTVFAITALEMLRRFQWVFFRVENEWNKINSRSSVQLHDIADEEDKLLVSNEHTV